MRILITGSRHWSDDCSIYEALRKVLRESGLPPEEIVLVHGACPTGADFLGWRAAKRLGMQIEPHPADWNRHGRAAGPLRNSEMVDLGAAICLGFPEPDSRGTLDCMRKARNAGIKVKNLGAHFEEFPAETIRACSPKA